MRRVLLVGATLALICGTAACSSGGGSGSGGNSGGTSGVVRWSTDQPAVPYFGSVLINAAASSVQKATNSQLTFKVYPGNTLYTNPEALQALTTGASLELANVSAASLAALVPDAGAFQMPYLLPKNAPHAYATLAGPDTALGKTMQQQAAKKNLVIVGGYFTGANPIFSKKSLVSPNDLRGTNMRVPSVDDVSKQVAKLFGFNAETIAVNDVGTSLRTGLIDAAVGTYAFFTTFTDAAKYAVDAGGLFEGADITVASKPWWDKLSSAEKTAFTTALVQLDTDSYGAINKANQASLSTLTKAGVTTQTWSAADISAAIAKTKPIYDSQRGKLGSTVVDFLLQEQKTLEGS